MSARIDDPYNTDPHHPDTNETRVRTSRGFARSDDGEATATVTAIATGTTTSTALRISSAGVFMFVSSGGATWAEQWTLWERQPEIPDAPCSDALVYATV